MHSLKQGTGGTILRLVTLMTLLVMTVSTVWSQDDVEDRIREQLKQSSQNSASQPAPTSQPQPGARDAIPRNPIDIANALGIWFVIPFVIASFFAVWFAIERIVILRRRRVIPRAFVDRFLTGLRSGNLDPQRAMEVCEQNGSPVANVFAHGIRKWGKPSVEVEQAIIDGGERQVSQLKKNLRVLNGVATVTPLIGLLGTVIGMIQAFNEIANADAMGKAQELAVGIALALLTTAAGLIIAIPCLTLYMYLSGRVDSLVIEMDELAQNVVHMVSAEGLRAREQAPRRPEGARAKKTRKAAPKEPAVAPQPDAV